MCKMEQRQKDRFKQWCKHVNRCNLEYIPNRGIPEAVKATFERKPYQTQTK